MKKLENAYALIIGVKDETLDTFIDANAIYNIPINEDLAAYDPNNILFVKGEESTKKHILDAFDKLKEMTNEESSIFLYYTGHGGYEYGEYFIQPYGMSNESEEIFKNTWVSAKQLKEKLNGLNSKRLIFFFRLLSCSRNNSGFQYVFQ